MPKDDLRYVGHMVDAAERARKFLSGKSRQDYDDDEVLRLAVVHLIQTIGEAARLVSPGFQQQHANVAWPQIIGMRNRIVHDYLLRHVLLMHEDDQRESGVSRICFAHRGHCQRNIQ